MKRPPGGVAETQIGLGVTHALAGERTTTHIRSGYELAKGQSLAEGKFVVGSSTQWQTDHGHQWQLTLDHRRPVAHNGTPEYGGTLGWTNDNAGGHESEWRLDYGYEKGASKYAVQWRSVHPFSASWSMRTSAFYGMDYEGQHNLGGSLSSAYRAENTAIVGRLSAYFTQLATGPERGGHLNVEWRLQGVHRWNDDWTLNVAYARKDTYVWPDSASVTPTVKASDVFTTDKWHVGGRVTWHPVGNCWQKLRFYGSGKRSRLKPVP